MNPRFGAVIAVDVKLVEPPVPSCPTCHNTFPAGTDVCPRDGATLMTTGAATQAGLVMAATVPGVPTPARPSPSPSGGGVFRHRDRTQPRRGVEVRFAGRCRPRRPLPDRAPHRRGRHGRRLRGQAHRHRQARRGEGVAGEVRGEERLRRAPAAGGAARELDRPRAHRRRHRLRHDRRRSVVRRHGISRRRIAGRAGDARGAAADRAQPGHRAPGGERARRRAREGDLPPRREAREHLPGQARRRRLREGRRLRYLEGGQAGRRRGRRGLSADAHGPVARDAALHVARAGARRGRPRPPLRHLGAGRAAVRVPDRRGAVPRQQLPRHHLAGADARADAAVEAAARAGHLGRGRGGRHARDGEGPRAPLPDDGRGGRRSGAAAGRRSERRVRSACGGRGQGRQPRRAAGRCWPRAAPCWWRRSRSISGGRRIRRPRLAGTRCAGRRADARAAAAGHAAARGGRRAAARGDGALPPTGSCACAAESKAAKPAAPAEPAAGKSREVRLPSGSKEAYPDK